MNTKLLKSNHKDQSSNLVHMHLFWIFFQLGSHASVLDILVITLMLKMLNTEIVASILRLYPTKVTQCSLYPQIVPDQNYNLALLFTQKQF